MRIDDFTSQEWGWITQIPGDRWAFPYFLPKPIPRSIMLGEQTVLALSDADAALGELAGLGTLIRDPELLLGPSLAQEALSSSRIEGTQASLSDVLAAESDGVPARDENLKEVSNYLDAAEQGVELIDSLPITQRFFCALHETLMTDVRGEEKSPGEIRRSPVWIGSTNARPETAKFVPPHQSHLGDLLADWERYVNEPSQTPAIVRCALMHYQFETIHPFLDGNGRIGRLLIGFVLMSEQRLPAPILYISGYFERNRQQYYDRLQAVRERGEIDEWIQFFCAAVAAQARESAARIRRLVEIREQYRADTQTDRSALPGLVDLVFRNPLVTVGAVQRALDVSQPTASALIKKAVARGWLRSLGRWGRGGRERWLADDIWQAVASPLDQEAASPRSS
ncbi:Fic family protein [Homoserinibacter sp. YIM 151385]|uniref:Fic family protein n=1 Tax=Homoserinibacter sp. YIM 151385 TaxID=2985506 RepID=UPI0022F084B4|nr:Fic family protein [Homoserinibacter sp. YIM 151385]WBU36826.1 Fic family protein [Homoserinibacter sp. YIM 151385]